MKGKFVWAFIPMFSVALIAGYLFRLGLKPETAAQNPINHGLIILGGLGLVFLCAVFVNSLLNHYIYKGRPWWMKILSFFGWLAIVPIILGTMMCLMEGAGIHSAAHTDAPERVIDAIFPEIFWMFKPFLFSLLYGLMCFAFFWTRFYVQKGSAVVLNGKIYYPGESYVLTPFYFSDLEKFPLEYKLPEFALRLKCDDTEFEVKIEPKVKLQFEKSLGERFLDPDKFRQKLKTSVAEYILDYAKHGTLGAFFSSKLPMEISVLGIPVEWDGKGSYTFVQE